VKRREFVKTVAAGAAASASGCVGLGLGTLIPGSEMSMAAMDQFLGRFDSGLEAISEGSMFDEMAAVIGKEHAESRRDRLDQAEALGKRAMRTLYVTGMFRDLPEEARLHPGVQERMWGAVPEMEQSIWETTALLENLSEEKRARLKRVLEEKPDTVARIGEALDRRAAAGGIPLKRRLHLRHMMFEVGGRLRHSPALAIDEYVGKVRKVESWSGDDAEIRRRLIAHHGKEHLWQLEQRSQELRNQWLASRRDEIPGWKKKKKSTGISAGAILAIMGLVVLAVSGILVASDVFEGVFGLTAGGLLLLIALIVAVVEAA